MTKCPLCQYEAGIDPDNDYKEGGDEPFIKIQQPFASCEQYRSDIELIYLTVCPKCGIVFHTDY